VYITDETSRHEITSWRLDDAPEPAPAVVEGQEGAGTAHFVMVVDMSGSMRRDDILGYSSRAHAVYECLARDLIEPQLKQGTEGIRVSECLCGYGYLLWQAEQPTNSLFASLVVVPIVWPARTSHAL
jgi:hypothetical protein